MSPTPKIFISYRRIDGPHSERLWDHLVRWFGEENVFFDWDCASIKPASEFPDALHAGVQVAEIFLAVIGPGWINEENLLRLKDEKDYVLRELKQALARRDAGENLNVLPLLVGGANMPTSEVLPPELGRLSVIQAHQLREGAEAYRAQIETLIELINSHCPGLRAQLQNAWVRDALQSPERSTACFYQDIAVRAPERQQPIKRLAAQSALDAWWGTWAEHHQAFVLLGEEGDGKSWATADWLADKLVASDFTVPIVFAPALHMASASVAEILAACLERSQPTPSERWPARLRDLVHQPPSATPLFLLVVDSFNERTSLDWRELFDSIRAPPWRGSVALLCLCRSPYWEHLNITNDGLITAWTLPSFNDTELEQALAQRKSMRSAFEPEVLHLMARPRYFDLAFRLSGQIDRGGLTLERLIYEDWRDMTGRKRQRVCSHGEFQALIADLAKEYGKKSFAFSAFAQLAQGIENDVASLIKELEGVHILDNQNGKLIIAERWLPLALGLVLAAEIEENPANDLVALAEIIAKRMGSYREADLQVRICGMALFHALNASNYPEVGCLALLRAWIEGRNLDGSDLREIAAYLPLRPKTYLHMAEYVWGEADNREVQDAFMVGFLRHRELPVVKSELVQTFTQWLGFVYPWGYRASFERDAEKLAEFRKDVEKRLGQLAVPGPVLLHGVQLEVVQNAGLLRLAQVALAVISHEHAKGYANALVTGITASTVMDGSHAEFPWVLHTCCSETRQALLLAARKLLAANQSIAYLVARKLLACLGNEEARVMQVSIPREFHGAHPLAQMFEEDPCHPFLGPWKKDNYLTGLQRNWDAPSLIVDQLKNLALDPDIAFPEILRQKLDDAGKGIDFTKTNLSMGSTIEEYHLGNMEPALCAIAPTRYLYLMRAWMQTLATRDGLARRQLAWHLLDHLPILGDEEAEIVLAAWRATLVLDGEHDKVAELALFPAVVFDLPPEEQLQRLTERGDAGGYFTKHAPCFRPLSSAHGPVILAALKAVEGNGSMHRLHNLLWYLTEALCHIDKAIQQYLLTRFSEFDTVSRGYCLELFVRTGDTEAAQQIATSSWCAQGGRENHFEDTWGSILLTEFDNKFPIADLATKIASEWLGHAVKKRGYTAEDLANYAKLINAIWCKVVARTPPPEVESISRYVMLKVNPESEYQAEILTITTDNNDGFNFTNYTWGGSAGVGSSNDLALALDADASIEKHNTLSQQVATLAENENRNGNPWFAQTFRDSGLAEVIALDDTLWRSWIEPVLRNDRRAWQLLGLCRGFYEKLCAALLTHAPEQGLELFLAMALRPTIRITDARLGLPLLLMDAFAAPASQQVEQLLRSHIDSGTADLDLFEIVMLCQCGGRDDWMRQLSSTEWQQTDNDYDRARGLALLGFSNAEADGAMLANWIATHGDCWLRDAAEIALQNHRRNVWARCWFNRFLSRSDRTEAWAAFRLFLRCVDRRFWLWFHSAELADVEPWKRDAITMSIGTIEDACKENEKIWKDQFLGQKVKVKELWPWMGAYQ